MCAHRDAVRLQYLQGNAARDAEGRGETTGEMSAAAQVVVPAVFDIRRIVGVRGARTGAERAVVRRAGVGVLNDRGDRRAGGHTVYDAAEKLRKVRLAPRGGGCVSAGRAPRHKGVQFFFVDADTGGNAFERHADRTRGRFAEDLDRDGITHA